MGRIKSLQIKRTAKKLLAKNKFSSEFEENKKLLSQYIETSKKTKNSIAGYITRLVKKSKS